MAERVEALLTSAGQAAADACLQSLKKAGYRYRERVAQLAGAAVILRGALALAARENWNRALRIISVLPPAARESYCRHMQRWANGKDPTWIDDIEGMPLPFREHGCKGEYSLSLPCENLIRLSEATGHGANTCASFASPLLGEEDEALWVPMESLVRPRVSRALKCLLEAVEAGAGDSGLLLLARDYLPALRLLRHEDLRSVNLDALPPGIASTLTSYVAAGSSASLGQCVPSHLPGLRQSEGLAISIGEGGVE